jgi:hypothetical protein
MWHPFNQPEYQGHRFVATLQPWTERFELRIARGEQVARITYEERGDWGEPISPILSIHADEMQHLFNALWDAGFRPPERARQDDIVSAKNDHLEDLRMVIKSIL